MESCVQGHSTIAAANQQPEILKEKKHPRKSGGGVGVRMCVCVCVCEGLCVCVWVCVCLCACNLYSLESALTDSSSSELYCCGEASKHAVRLMVDLLDLLRSVSCFIHVRTEYQTRIRAQRKAQQLLISHCCYHYMLLILYLCREISSVFSSHVNQGFLSGCNPMQITLLIPRKNVYIFYSGEHQLKK